MRKFVVAALGFTTFFVFTASAFADSAGREMCVAKCKEAVQLINDKGLDAATAVINSSGGGFAWKDGYLFVVDFQGITIAHATAPLTVGMDLKGFTTSDGRKIILEFIEIAKTKGEGWVEYLWPKPEEMSKPRDQRISSPKASYVLRVPGKDMFVVAGVHQ